MSPTWTLDELAHAGPDHLDADFVAGYDRKQGFPSPEPDLDVLASHGALGPTVVDLGTGTGRFAVAAAARCERVVAVDVSPAMLAHVRSSAPSTVEVVHAGFLTYEHTGPPADAVHTRNALHSTYRWLLEPMLERTGFEVLDASYARRVYATYTCRRR